MPAASFAAKVPVVEDVVKAPEVPLSGKAIEPVEQKRSANAAELLDNQDGVSDDEKNKVMQTTVLATW